MVFAGHSMGGLVSKLLTVDSGDAFWKLVSTEPFDKLRAEERTRQSLQRVFFLRAWQPCVQARGVSGDAASRLKVESVAAGACRPPFHPPAERRADDDSDLSLENPGYLFSDKPGKVPTSLDLLAPPARRWRCWRSCGGRPT